MAEFNYKNAYKLAVQTNRELHLTLESYKIMVKELQISLEERKHEVIELREQLRAERLKNAHIE